MKIHLLRSKELSRKRFRAIYELANSFAGPIEFIVKKEDMKDDEDDETEGDNKEELEDEVLVRYKEFINENGEIILPWTYIFDTCKDYRSKKAINKDELIVFFTDYKNQRNFLSAWDPTGMRNFFIHTSMWAEFIDSESTYPIMSELASLPLALAAFDNMEEAEKWGHPEPRGCTFDYCKNKTDVRLKMRTGDICPDCNELIKRRGIDPAVAKQVFAIFDEVREQVLFRDRFKIIREPSRLNVNMLRQDLILTDIGNTSIHLAPREMTIYCLFLNHPEGIFFKDMRDHEIEIGKLYRRFSYDTVTATIENRIKNMAENEEDTVSYLINHINKKLRENLGEEIAAYYIIQGGRAENHKITLDRKKVSKTEL